MLPVIRSATVLIATGCLIATAAGTSAQDPHAWTPHDPDRPRPPKVEPGPPTAPALPPSDAVVLFDGGDLSRWRAEDGGTARWRAVEGEDGGWFEVVPGTGSLVSADSFGDVQLHVEWAAPAAPTGEGQDWGNSGVYLMGLYEVQVLNTYDNPTYADGHAAALYGQYPPLVNASRPPGQWQSYDIVFRAPGFDQDGQLLRPARVTVLHNGVLVQDAVELTGPTAYQARPPYTAHADRLPISLQDHGSAVRYRNIWVRPLDGS